MKRDSLKAASDRKAKTGVAKAQREISGNLDLLGPVHITGWLFDKACPDQRLELEVISGGVPLARSTASLYRRDLHEAKLGDGHCAFSLTMPDALLDGQDHEVYVREVSTGFELPGSPRQVRGHVGIRGHAQISNGVLTGHSRLPAGQLEAPEIELWENEKLLASGTAQQDGIDPAVVQFRVSLPLTVFDGRPHGFTVRVKGASVVLAYVAEVVPFMSTPESALLQYAREGVKPRLSTAAGFRYEALTKALEHVSNGEMTPASAQAHLRQLTQAHAVLVKGADETRRSYPPLNFSEHGQPRVSIVIPAHNKFHVTYHCLLSLSIAPSKASFEVIVVDDGSSDMTKKLPEIVKGVKYVRNEEAEGFIRACNRGAVQAVGQYIVMLNNDTEVTSGWLDELLWTFEHFDNVGMVGAKLIYPDGTLQEAGGVIWSSGNPWNYGRGANANDPRFNYARQTDYLSGACIMLPTSLWNEIGGFSETYIPAYFEDTDLAFQVRALGYKTVYAPLAQVIHFEGVSNGTSVSSGTKRFQELNRPKFKSRWAAAYRGHGAEGVDLELNKDRNVSFRALVIDAETPMPDKNAGSYAAIQEMRMLQALGFKCTFVPQNLAWMGAYTEALQRMGVESLFAPFFSSVKEVIQSRGREFDLVYITRYYVAQPILDAIRQWAPQAKIVLCNADLHFLRELRTAVQADDKGGITAALKTRDDELFTMRNVDLVLSYTDVEKAVILSHNLSSTRVARCPWVVEVPRSIPPFDQRVDIAFLGGFNHRPNVEAVDWFVRNVMPLMKKQLPGVRLRVFGSNAPKSLHTLAEHNSDVIIDGWIEDVAQAYNTCRVFVAPLQNGAGIKGKVIGALAFGLPSVLSPIAAEGIAGSDGNGAVIASRAQDWVNAIAKLYQDEKTWTKASQAAQAYAFEQYGFERGVMQMKDALQVAELFTAPDPQALALNKS
jgi:GT2 family glycosyltransferase/glycosyltransferase involved in cell wall biosynthesis